MQCVDLAAAKTEIFAKLAASGFVRAEVVYDGYDDNGQTTLMTAFDAERSPAVIMTDYVPVAAWKTLADDLEAFFWAVLDTFHSGFENNDGGHGTLTIDAATNTVKLEHSDHYIAYDETVTEV